MSLIFGHVISFQIVKSKHILFTQGLLLFFPALFSAIQGVIPLDKSRLVVIEHRETGQRYLFDLIHHNFKPYLDKYRVITMTIPLTEKRYLDLPLFDSY
jgi:hypothetical protein